MDLNPSHDQKRSYLFVLTKGSEKFTVVLCRPLNSLLKAGWDMIMRIQVEKICLGYFVGFLRVASLPGVCLALPRFLQLSSSVQRLWIESIISRPHRSKSLFYTSQVYQHARYSAYTFISKWIVIWSKSF